MRHSGQVCFILFILFLFGTDSLAQTRFNNAWVNGGGGIVRVTRFDKDTIAKQYYTGVLNTVAMSLGHSNICDSNGRLTLLCDGLNLYDSNLTYIDGGEKLNYDAAYLFGEGTVVSESQYSIILPFPNSKYYMINNGPSDYCWSTSGTTNYIPCDNMLYHKVDMKANGGLGKVTHRMQILDTGRFNSIGMMACKHANKQDWWLLKLGGDSMTFYTYLFKEDTIIKYGEQIFGGFPPSESGQPGITFGNIEGQMMFNQQGTQMMCAVRSTKRSFHFDFDRSTGLLSNAKYFNTPRGSVVDTFIYPLTGGCFSPNGRFMYVGTVLGIWQRDLQDADSSTSWYKVAEMDTTLQEFQSYANLYPGPDGKVYIGNWNGLSKQMSIILRPNEKGMDCLFCPRCLRYDSVYNYPGISQPPCMPNYDLDVEPLSTKDITELKGFMVYPNPASTTLTIESDHFSNQENEIIITTMLGQVVQRQQFKTSANKYKLDISGLARGVYWVTIKSLGEERQVFGVRKVVVE